MIKTALKRIVGALALGMMPAMVQAQVPIDLRMKFKPGEINKYQTTINMTMTMLQPGSTKSISIPLTMVISQQQKVVKSLPDGGGQILTTVIKQQMTMNGQSSPTPSQVLAPITTDFSARGKILKIVGLPNQPGAGGMMGMSPNMFSNMSNGTFLPTHPVRPGDSWTQAIHVPGFTNSATARSKFVRVESIGSFQTAHIHTTISLPLNIMLDATQKPTTSAAAALATVAGTFDLSADSNLAIAEGKLVRSGGDGHMILNVKSKQKSPHGAPQSVKMNIQMHLANALVP